MTVCEQLAVKNRENGERVTAWKMLDKFSTVYRYEITVSKNGIAYEVVKTARTTWKKKFNEM